MPGPLGPPGLPGVPGQVGPPGQVRSPQAHSATRHRILECGLPWGGQDPCPWLPWGTAPCPWVPGAIMSLLRLPGLTRPPWGAWTEGRCALAPEPSKAKVWGDPVPEGTSPWRGALPIPRLAGLDPGAGVGAGQPGSASPQHLCCVSGGPGRARTARGAGEYPALSLTNCEHPRVVATAATAQAAPGSVDSETY